MDGYRVEIVDADLVQQHSSESFADRVKESGRGRWIGRTDMPDLTVQVGDRSSPEIPDAAIVLSPQADQDSIDIIQSLTDALDVVICDLQGSASVSMIHAIHYADLVLIPVQPSNDDLKSCHSTARHGIQAGKSSRRVIQYRIVVSRASTGFKPEVERVIEEALEDAGLPRLRIPVFERTAFKKASFSRIAAIFDDPDDGAARNMIAVYAEVRDMLASLTQPSGKAAKMATKLTVPQLGRLDEVDGDATSSALRPNLRTPAWRTKAAVDTLLTKGSSRKPGSRRSPTPMT